MIIWKPEDTQEPDLERDGEITTFKSILTDEKIAEMLRSLKTPDVMEKFIVKHYCEDEYPTIKGNGFDGLIIGEDREEAQEFVDYINAIVDKMNEESS